MRWPAASLCLLLAACGSAPPPAAPSAPGLEDSRDLTAATDVTPTVVPPSPVGRGPAGAGRPLFPDTATTGNEVLYRVGGVEITKAEVGDFVLRYVPERSGEVLTQLLDEALAELDAAREGVTLAPGLVDARVDAHLEATRREARVQYGTDVDLATVLERRFGSTVERYRRDAARLERTRLLIDRLALLDRRRVERVDLRVLVLPSETAAREALRRLREGADMALLASAERVRPPAAPPPLTRDEIGDPELAAKLFEAEPGDYIEPVAFSDPDDPGRTFHQVFRVVRHLPASDRPWSELRDEIERELGAGARTGPREYLLWKRRAMERHGVEVLEGARGLVPFGGEPAPSGTEAR